MDIIISHLFVCLLINLAHIHLLVVCGIGARFVRVLVAPLLLGHILRRLAKPTVLRTEVAIALLANYAPKPLF